uniref:Uncharacterized protein n=1 Tax=Ascaris lumbricoides TaxID=6252 RepID=A0A0M3IU09_ASCLU
MNVLSMKLINVSRQLLPFLKHIDIRTYFINYYRYL